MSATRPWKSVDRAMCTTEVIYQVSIPINYITMQCSLLSGRVVSALPSKARWIKSTQRHAATTRCLAVAKPSDALENELSNEMKNIDVSDASNSNDSIGVVMPAAVASTLLYPLVMSDPALAIGREYGIVEGQIFSLMHPAFMFFLLGASLYAGYLGFQWRRVRELGTEIKGLKAQRDASAPKSEEGGERPPSPLDATIASLESVRSVVVLVSCMVAVE